MRKGTIMQQINEGLWGVMVRMWIRGVSGQVSAISFGFLAVQVGFGFQFFWMLTAIANG